MAGPRISIIGLPGVQSNISKIFLIRRAQVTALSNRYAALALQTFQSRQLKGVSGEYWENRTFVAAQRVFSSVIQDGNIVGFSLSHGVQYGIYLELANDRKRAAIFPIIVELLPRFMADLRFIYT